MTIRFKMLVYFLLAVIMTGCSPLRNRAVPTKEATFTPPLASSSPTVTLTVTAQATPMSPGVTPTPSPSPTTEPSLTQTPETGEPAIPVCTGKGQVVSKPADFGITGTLVYQMSGFYGLFTMGGRPVRQAQLLDSKQQAVVYGFSPDGEWLAYAPLLPRSDEEIIFRTPVMILLSASGERMEQEVNISGLEKELYDRCPSCEGYQFSSASGEWINNKLLYIHLGVKSQQGSMYSSLPKVFDPFTGVWQDEWMNSLPNLSPIYLTRGGIDHIKLSPDLSRVLYPASGGGVILWDVVQGVEILFEQEFATPHGEHMEWSPDSKMVAVSNFGVNPDDSQLLLISRDGEVTKIAKGESPSSIILYLSTYLIWSPDSRYLAIVNGYDEGIENLHLYDTQTAEYVYRCPLPGMTNSVPNLVWSPDSKWIAFGDRPDGPMQLLNVQTGEVIELLENAIPVGWSDKFPVEWP